MSLKENQPKTSNEEEEICEFAMQLTSASVLPMALKAAIELNVLEIIAQAGSGAQLSSVEIASNFPTQNPEAPDMLERILRLLASHSVLNCSCRINDDGRVQRMYGLGPVCRYFVPNQDGASFTPLLLMFLDKAFMESWYHLKDAVLEGGPPFNKAHGMNAFKYFEKDPRFSTIFRNAMSDYNIISMKKILDMYKGFEGVRVLVDVGGGVGSILNMIISKHPKIKGINFDLPQLIEKAPCYPGVEHVGGDMFASVPKGDAIFMKWILHMWNDEHCLKILKNCYDAIPENGKVVIMDLIIPESTETIVHDKCLFQFDLSLMTTNPEGKERTETEFDALAKKVGFVGTKVMRWASNFSIMEFYKTM